MGDVGAALVDHRLVHVGLHAAGYDPGPPVGPVGEKLYEPRSLMQFQIDSGLRPTGEADDATERLLVNALADDYVGILSRGAHAPRQVETLQRMIWLLELPVEVDGIYGPETEQAVRAFQQRPSATGSQYLDVDGIVGPQTWSAMTGLDEERLPPLVVEGNKGAQVLWVQRVLDATGYEPGPIDGIFGSDTRRAVQDLQRQAAIEADGIVGPDTRRALRRYGARPLGDGFRTDVLQVAFVDGVPQAYVCRDGQDGILAVDLGGDGEDEILTPDPSEPVVDAVVPFGSQVPLVLADASSSLWSHSSGAAARALTTNQWGRPGHVAAAHWRGDLQWVVNDADGGHAAWTMVDDPAVLSHATDPVLFRHGDQWRVAWIDVDGMLHGTGTDLDEASTPPIAGTDGPFTELRIGGAPDDAFLVTRESSTRLIQRWDPATGARIPGDQPDGSDADSFDVSRNLIAVAREDGIVHFHGRTGSEPLPAPICGAPTRIARLAIAQHGGAIAVGVLDRKGGLHGWTLRSEVSTGRSDFVQDQPSRTDLLGRRLIASEMSALMRRMATEEDRADVFAIHLDGQWGSGKSTVVGFVADDLLSGDTPWVVAEMDAWRSSQMSPAWWALLTHLRQAVRPKKGRLARIRFDLALWWWEARRSWRLWVPALVVLGALGALWILNADVEQLVARTTGLVAAIGAFAVLGSRFLSLSTLQGARLHERTDENPMGVVVEQILWLRRKSNEPILLVLDDLDRCKETFTVELLDAVQTLIRSPVVNLVDGTERSGTRKSSKKSVPVMVILAVGDQRWLRAAYENSYHVFKDFVAEEGRPLGHLFLNKLFQVSVGLPTLAGDQYAGYLNRLLGGDGSSPRAGGDQVTTPVLDMDDFLPDGADGATSYDRAIAAINSDSSRSARQRTELLGVALEMRRNDVGREARERHLLEHYSDLLDPNPRSAKRFIMAYNLAFAARVSEPLEPIDPETLALWTVLTIRWPMLTDWIRGELPYLTLAAVEGDGHPSKLLEKDAVRDVLNSNRGGPLDPARIRRCCGYPPLVTCAGSPPG
jgi:peptidoglycan hydrolase-like protein with peptidoglycan-binding domain